MSIINDALKKTQMQRKNEKEKRAEAIAAQAGSSKPEQNPGSNPGPQKPARMTLWIVASMLTIAGLLVIIDLTNTQGIEAVKHFAMAAVNKTRNKFKLVLDGVIVSDDTRIALINKQPMQLGDSVNGMKIVAINMDTIRLQNEKGIVELKTGATYLL